jgi:hypothetical protein
MMASRTNPSTREMNVIPLTVARTLSKFILLSGAAAL